MINNKKQSICVVGAGIIGVTAAYRLQKQGYQVTLIDKDGVCENASFGNAGHFATAEVFPLADFSLLMQLPKMLLDPLGPIRIKPSYFFKALPWFCKFLLNMRPAKRAYNSQAIKSLNSLAVSEMKQLATEVGCVELTKFDGSLLVFEKTPLPLVVREWRTYSDAGVAVRLISGDEARRLEPALSDNIEHALYFTETGHTLDPKDLALAIYKQFVAEGGQFIQGCLQDNNSASEWTIRSLERHEYIPLASFDKTLLTTGAWSKQFLKPIGHKVPLDTERGYHLMLSYQSALTRPVTSYERKFIITPMAKGTRLAGMVEFGGLEKSPTKGCSDRFKIHSRAILPELINETYFNNAEEWMGFRPSFPDSLPVIGATKRENLFVSFGHQHLGLTWSAISAKLVTQKIMGKETDIDLSPYSIERF